MSLASHQRESGSVLDEKVTSLLTNRMRLAPPARLARMIHAYAFARGVSHQMSRSVASCLIVTAALLLAPSTAFAGKAESETFFANGRELRMAGKCAEAIPEFRRALETYPDGLG